ncbi:MAG: hypothetical protein ACOY6E_09210 [Pseudomonadota bacterium]|jgi:hypothetical protein
MSNISSSDLVVLAALRAIEALSNEKLAELELRNRVRAMRKSGEACCGTCLHWRAVSHQWMREQGRTRPRVEVWTGHCTYQNLPPRRVRGDRTERQEDALPCRHFEPRDSNESPFAAAPPRGPQEKTPHGH